MWVIVFGFKLAISSLRSLLESGGGFLENAFRGHKLMTIFPKTLYWKDGCPGEHMGWKERERSG